MAFDTAINRFLMMSIFPDLKNDNNFKLLSDRDDTYNCIAWAMGYNDRWVDIEDSPGHWWPNGVSKDMSPQSLIDAFCAEGFEISDNADPEDGYYKAVLYKSNFLGNWTHAARILTSEIEYSKFGKLWDGLHSHNVLSNTGFLYSSSSYGEAFAYMKKAIAVNPTEIESEESETDSSESNEGMSIDLENLAKMRDALGKGPINL